MNKAFQTQEGKKAILDYYDFLLEKLEVPYEQLSVDTRYGHTSILAAGEKTNPTVILLHGSGMNATMWIRDMNEFAKKYRVYAPDMPGEPGKSDEEQLPFDNMAYAEWLYDVFYGLNVKKAVLAGESLGAWLAAKFTINHPDMVEKLILLCPAGIGSQNHKFKDIAFNLLSKGEEGVNQLFAEINGGADLPEEALFYQKLIATAFNFRQEEIPRFTDEDLQKITMPSLLIVGEKDIMLNSQETAARYKACVPPSTIHILPEAGHALTGFSAEISAFIERP